MGGKKTKPEATSKHKGYLDEAALDSIAKHKYATIPYTFLDDVYNRYIWERLVCLLPKSVHPNVVTIAGTL
jgi:hypothetical protein